MNGIATFRTMPGAVRLLLVNHLVGHVGFYLLVPFLAEYLLDDLALSAAVVGVVLGVRNLSQQGLFLVGGSAADRLGARGVIMTGLAVRALGFALFAVGGSLPVVLAASVLTGFAGALFNPAVRALIARDSGARSAQAFALFNVFGNAGSAIGPVVGTVLIAAGFRISALVAAAIFAVLAVVQWLLLPARPVPRHDGGVGADFATVFTDRRFWAFTLALMPMFALMSQIYFLFTLQAQDSAGPGHGPAAVAALFVVETIAVVALQVRVTSVLARRPQRGPAMALGMAIMGVSFLLPPAAAGLVAKSGDGLAGTAFRVAPVVAAAVLLAIGVTAVQPFVNEAIGRFAGRRLTGTYFGAFYLASGVFTVAATSVTGAVLDRSGGPLTWPPALLCAAAGLLSAVALLELHRRHLLPGPDTVTADLVPGGTGTDDHSPTPAATTHGTLGAAAIRRTVAKSGETDGN
ncbi:MFS transporter [Nocardia rhizosphaerihabitans]|uniref:ABC transport system membrane protein n=1 Tax=Nocardia rhizosphaerihabitans TaxID=1691570 RepID=A0ABQ2KQ71_9NOCA|nr:MFS transporter [Nocardia rhizosphaerihabitans]GGN90139.1 putative ABC transport system membrane protein [Nocardia rhizosphaerihabitans]